MARSRTFERIVQRKTTLGVRVQDIIVNLVVGLAFSVLLWAAFLWVMDLPKLIAKSPGDVWYHVVSGPQAAVNRRTIGEALATTGRDAVLGFVSGTFAAVVLACIVHLSNVARAMIVPIAICVKSVPMLALTPVAMIVMGRGYITVALIVGLSTFLPTFVNYLFGLSTATRESCELVEVLGGGRFRQLVTVEMPSATTALYASMRLAVPNALLGALVAEYLASGDGLGWLLSSSQVLYDYTTIWAGVAILVIVGLVLYAVMGIAEAIVLNRRGELVND